MIYEVATIKIKESLTKSFEAGVKAGIPLFNRAAGCHSFRLERSIEEPLHYRIIIGWSTVDDHVVGFRTSADFGRWRELVADCFDGAPSVEHTRVIIEGF